MILEAITPLVSAEGGVEDSTAAAVLEESSSDEEDEDWERMHNEKSMIDQLKKLDDKLLDLRNKSKVMMIAGVEYELSDKDPIFSLSAPTKQEIRTPGCAICHDVIKKERHIVFCQFCSKSHCENCAYKEREFPRAFPDAKGQKLKGIACKICDRKFLMAGIQIQNAVSAQSKAKMVKGMEQKIESIMEDNINLV